MASRTQARSRAPRQPQSEQSTAIVPFDAKDKADKLVAAIDTRRDQIASFLQVKSPEEYERFVNIAVDAIVRDNGLLSADLLSLVSSIRHAAIMGLEPTSVMGEGAIVVYRDNAQGGKRIAQFQPMVRGLTKLARNSGEIASIGVDVVHANDVFEYHSGSDPKVIHQPVLSGDQGDVIGAYAYAKLRSGELVSLYLTTPELHKRRRVSKSFQQSGESSIWGQWPEEMMKKTVLRRLLVEKVPLSFRAQTALALDAEIDKASGEPDKVEATVTRTARRLLAHPDVENGSGDEKKPEPDPSATSDGAGQQGPPEAPVEASAKALCPEPTCTREPHDETLLHRNADGETWPTGALVAGDSRDG